MGNVIKFVGERNDVVVMKLPVITDGGMVKVLKFGVNTLIINDRFVLGGVPRIDDLKILEVSV